MGGENGIGLSVARSLGRRGVDVHLLARPDCLDRRSRYVRYIDLGNCVDPGKAWAEFLLTSDSDRLRGAVLMAGSDIGLEVLIEHRRALSRKYLLDVSNVEAQSQMLNKLSTYQVAVEAGVPTPLFWEANDREQLHRQREEYVYPLMVKPLYSHRFTHVFRYAKHFVAKDYAELSAVYDEVWRHGIKVLLVEVVPGPDSRLCSYYTYIDERGQPLFHFTKRVIRRYPPRSGLGTYHITDDIPEVGSLGLQLVMHARLLGLANTEFKRDDRDGRLKLIECNARFTAVNHLVAAAGIDLAWLVYSRAIGCSPPLVGNDYRVGMRMLRPGWDFLAYLALRPEGDISFFDWAGSIMHHQQFQYFSWTDPGPWVASGPPLPGRLLRYLRRGHSPETAGHADAEKIQATG
jgi:D-aspartate ligase